jgi:hypothetical protein
MEKKDEEQPKQNIDTRPRDFYQAPPISNNVWERAADPQRGWAGDGWSGNRASGRNWGGRDR